MRYALGSERWVMGLIWYRRQLKLWNTNCTFRQPISLFLFSRLLMLAYRYFANIGDVLSHPVAMGIGLGLVFGKLIGIAGFTWAAAKLGVSELPKGLNMSHIIGVSSMGDIGFTMSIFIAELGFVNHPEDFLMAKTGILFASLTVGLIGFTWLYLTFQKQHSSSDDQELVPENSHH